MLTWAGPLVKQTSLYMWRKKLQPATLFVVLNMPPVCYEFPNLDMRAILEWTPGRVWRQSEDRELHLKKTPNPLKEEKIRLFQTESFFYNDLLKPGLFRHEQIRKNITCICNIQPKRSLTPTQTVTHLSLLLEKLYRTLFYTWWKETSEMFNEGEWHSHYSAAFNSCLSFVYLWRIYVMCKQYDVIWYMVCTQCSLYSILCMVWPLR